MSPLAIPERRAVRCLLVIVVTLLSGCPSGVIHGPKEGQGSDAVGNAHGDVDAGDQASADSGSPAANSGDGDVTQPSQPGDDTKPDAAVSSDAGGPASVPLQGPTGPSAGCGSAAPAQDSASGWTQHDIMVTGVADRYLQGGADYGNQNGFDFANRNYYVRLPKNYDPSKHYPLLISGGGCGATNGTSGDGGGSNPLDNDQDVAVQVGLSYVYPAHGGACFQDDGGDTPDLPFFDAVLAELDKTYCFDRAQVFMSGFSSGAWETYMLACARGGVVRGIGTQAGGLRQNRPECSNIPVAAFLTAGANDGANPITNIDQNGYNSGSEAARDWILATNKCATKDTEAYITAEAPADWNCVRYTSCPAEYPVIWCAITADGGGHGAGNNKAYWPFWSMLPTH